MLCVCNYQRFSIRDGPGIRTTIFLKGCNLRCGWCHNPEAINPEPEPWYFEKKCLHCGLCAKICPIFLSEGGFSGFSKTCIHCGECARVCPSGALEVIGQLVTAEDAFDVLTRDRM
ncbi:MAG: 4Fe-4S binding protein, partial [Treponema sp.]|nr:4Fe-4S binding protein [Treponema sp.]